MKTKQKSEGFVLTGVMMLLLIAALVGGAFLFSARSSFATVDQWRDRDDCLCAIQSAIEAREYDLYTTITNSSIDSMDHLGNMVSEPWAMVITNNYSMSPSTVRVKGTTSSGAVVKSSGDNSARVTITNIVSATLGRVTRKIREVITYTYSPQDSLGGDGSVFDNIFFIDNIGLFSGVNCDFNGDVYANKDLDLQYSSLKVNGDRYSGADIVSRKDYKNDSWSGYGNSHARPAENTDYDRSNTNTYWEQGYDDDVQSYEWSEIKEMPFIGPLSEYAAFAIANNGTVSQVYSVSSTGVLSNRNISASGAWGYGGGENAGIGTNDTGCLILIGTVANPIVISNIVVATGDIYIKGYFTGQGTLYSGRNIYIIGDLIANDPPLWPHPDPAPRTTAAANATKDFIGLCAKGNIALGRPTALDISLMVPPFTGSHATDISDIALGYVSYVSNGVPYFNGDYTQRDANGTATRSDGSDRHFYDPMISTNAFEALGPTDRLGWIDGVLYANHLIGGDFHLAVMNGAFVCRDESVHRTGDLELNWDIRIGSRSYERGGSDLGLLGMFISQGHVDQITKWTELAP
jgi:type II secretory pathway pseudopilin PulG